MLRCRLNEENGWLTEPDVVLDFGDRGIVVIEAKLTSQNEEQKAGYGGWLRYLNGIAFRDQQLARSSGLYQLVRNWRLGFELAGKRPLLLINLARIFDREERRKLAMLRASLCLSVHHRFRLRNWEQICATVPPSDWVIDYCRKPRVN